MLAFPTPFLAFPVLAVLTVLTVLTVWAIVLVVFMPITAELFDRWIGGSDWSAHFDLVGPLADFMITSHSREGKVHAAESRVVR